MQPPARLLAEFQSSSAKERKKKDWKKTIKTFLISFHHQTNKQRDISSTKKTEKAQISSENQLFNFRDCVFLNNFLIEKNLNQDDGRRGKQTGARQMCPGN